MVVGASTIHDKIKEFIEKNYKEIEEWRIPFCVLDEDERYYRVNIEFRKKGEYFGKTASLKVDADSGEIIEFKEGWYWRF
jgi:hypothetical protein